MKKSKKKLLILALVFFATLFSLVWWGMYVPSSREATRTVVYTAKRGASDDQIADDLEKQGIIKSSLLFKLYVIVSGKHARLQAGSYNLSPSLSIAKVVEKFVAGDVIRDKVVIVEGWSSRDIARYLEAKKLYSQKDFLEAAQQDFTQDFPFLKEKPDGLSLEGYLFPDTYEITPGQTPEALLKTILANFDKKLTPDLEKEIVQQHKSLFQMVTMASIIEKEVPLPEDKKVVAGILWKRLEHHIPLQIDSTINYITGKSDAKAALKDITIDSPYNTYKYQGLPKGPISNPGLESILAAVYPKASPYWYYLSVDHTGKTIFSKTLEEHTTAIAKYLNP